MIHSSVGIQLLTVLVVGLLTALALQCLLTSLGAAIALSTLRFRSIPPEQSDTSSSPISAVAGLGVLFTVNLVLFAACFLATRFSGVESPLSGAIAGLVVWSAYVLLVLWVGAIAVSSVLRTMLNVTTGGLGRMVKVVKSAFQSSAAEPITEDQMMATIRQEIQATLAEVDWQHLMAEQSPTVATSQTAELGDGAESVELWQTVMAYLQTANAKNLTPKRLERKLQKLLQSVQTGGVGLPAIDRTGLTLFLEQRQDLTTKQKDRILGQIEAAWEQVQETQQRVVEKVQPAVALTTKVLQAVVEKTVDGVMSQDEGLGFANHSWGTHWEHLLNRSGQQIETIQQAAKERLATLQQQTQQQVERTRQIAATAAWWLFLTTATGALSAAFAGALAAGFNPVQFLPFNWLLFREAILP